MSTPDLNLLVTLDVLLAEGSVARLAPLPTSASDELRAVDPSIRSGNGSRGGRDRWEQCEPT